MDVGLALLKRRMVNTEVFSDYVKEGINFPAVNKEHNYVTDTVTVYRPVANL